LYLITLIHNILMANGDVDVNIFLEINEKKN